MSNKTDDLSQIDETSIKGHSITPAITALIMPTAEYLGKELRDYIKSNIENIKLKKQQDNLNAHLQAVRAKLEEDRITVKPISSTFSQITFFEKWVENAQNIDPENIDISAIWQSLLTRAARGEEIPDEIIEVLNLLTPSEAELLMKISSKREIHRFWRHTFGLPVEKYQYLVTSMQNKKLLEKNYAPTVLSLSFALFYFSILYYFVDRHEFGDSNVFTMYKNSKEYILSIFLALPFFVAFGYYKFDIVGWKLTWLGKKLIQRIELPSLQKAGHA